MSISLELSIHILLYILSYQKKYNNHMISLSTRSTQTYILINNIVTAQNAAIFSHRHSI